MSFAHQLKRLTELKTECEQSRTTHHSSASLAIHGVGKHHSPESGADSHVALLFVTIDGLPLEHVWRAWMREYHSNVHVFIHAKYPHKIQSDWVRRHLVLTELQPEWGSLDIVKVQLKLLDRALTTCGATKFCFLSESCVPVTPCRRLVDEVIRHSVLNTRQQPENGYVEQRQFQPLREFLTDSQIVKADQWCILTRADARDVASTQDSFLPIFENVHCSDEMYLATVLRILGRTVREEPVTFTEWNDPCDPSPVFISMDTLQQCVRAGTFYFARKVSPRILEDPKDLEILKSIHP